MLNNNVETFIACDKPYEEADIVIFGAPFDSTTSFRPGTRFASKAIRGESFGLETYSPYQDKDLTEIAVFDSGDLELCFGDSEKALAAIEERADIILNSKKIPLMIGGEHLVSLGAVRAAYKKYPDLHLIQFDAHTDLREDYLGAKLSHASVIRRCHDFLGDGRIHQFGIRSGEKVEFEWAKEHTDLHRFNLSKLENSLSRIRGSKVYFTIDLDVLDPSVFPGTGTPEAGGISFLELLEGIRLVAEYTDIIACDVNELSPIYDQSGASTATACKVIRELLLAI
jgi:agmatinase